MCMQHCFSIQVIFATLQLKNVSRNLCVPPMEMFVTRQHGKYLTAAIQLFPKREKKNIYRVSHKEPLMLRLSLT